MHRCKVVCSSLEHTDSHGDLLCPRCRVLTAQTGGDTHSKMTPTTGTHGILIPETETYISLFDFILLLSG
jgi:hypothetical protein